MSKAKNHILIIRLSAMGDVAMTVPILRAFTQQYPKVKITVLTRPFFAPFFRDLQNATIFPIDVKRNHKGILGLYKLSKELKALNINAVADLHNVLRTKILKFFFFGKQFVQIDKGRAKKKALVSGKAFKPLKSTHQRYADVFKKLGFPLDLTQPKFPQKAMLSEKLLTYFSSERKTIGIAPFAQYESKMYPLNMMEQVIENLSKTYCVLLFGSQNEASQLQQFENAYNNVKSVAGQLTLNEELDVISNLEVMLSMDSANAHIAAMLGVKVVTIWSVTHPFAGFYPFYQSEQNALLANRDEFPLIPTSIYGNKFPESYKNAAASIPVQSVVDRVEAVISIPK